MARTVVQEIAVLLNAYQRCVALGNTEWQSKHRQFIIRLVREYLPSGGGFDNGTHLDFDASKPDRLIFQTAYRHYDESGIYDCWTSHSIIVTPSLGFGFHLRITGRDRNQIKEYMYDGFHHGLSQVVRDDDLKAKARRELGFELPPDNVIADFAAEHDRPDLEKILRDLPEVDP